MGKDLLQKTRIALFVDSTIKSSYNSNNTLMDVRLMNMPCTTLNEMAEVTDKMFTPAAAETIPLPPILVYSNVIDHLALRGSLRLFDTLSTRFTEGFVTDEVTAYVETMSHIATMMKIRNQTQEQSSCHPLGTSISRERCNNSCTWCWKHPMQETCTSTSLLRI